MKFVIPVSSHDAHRLSKLVDLMLGFGGLQGHSCVLVPTPMASSEASIAADRLKPTMISVEVHNTGEDFSEAQVHVNQNKHFWSAVRYLQRSNNQETWMWLEPDCAPCDDGWANSLERAYKMGGRPCMGNIVQVPFIVGNVLTYRPTEQMMMGVAIYPPNLLAYPDMNPILVDLGKGGHMAPQEPFDLYLRGELRRIGWSHTDLIEDMWDTEKYTVTEKGLEAKSKPKTRLVRERKGLVDPQAVLIHGCKDDSLYDILMERLNARAEQEQARAANTPTEVIQPKLSKDEQFALRVEAVFKELGGSGIRIRQLAQMWDQDVEALTVNLRAAGYTLAQGGWIQKSGK